MSWKPNEQQTRQLEYLAGKLGDKVAAGVRTYMEENARLEERLEAARRAFAIHNRELLDTKAAVKTACHGFSECLGSTPEDSPLKKPLGDLILGLMRAIEQQPKKMPG